MQNEQAKEFDWFEDTDDFDNSIWLLPSPYVVEEGGFHLYWRLKPRVVDNQIQWYDCSDKELIGDSENFWGTLKEAKAAVEKAHQKILDELAEEEEDDGEDS